MQQLLDSLAVLRAPLEAFSLWGNTGWDYALAGAVFVALLLVLKAFQVVILARLRRLAKRTKTDFDDVLIEIFTRVKPPFYLLIALFFGVKAIAMSPPVALAVRFLFIVVIVYEVVRALERVVGYGIDRYVRSSGAGAEHSRAIVRSVGLIVRTVLWAIGLLVILSNLGVNVTSLLAGLGIGGLAIALALQSILGDMFSSISIYVDKPFQVGDFINVGTDKGTVEHIGLKSTRIRALAGNELVIPNKELTGARVENFGRMERRRVTFTIGVTYGTSAKKLEAIPGIVEAAVKAQRPTTFERCSFASYGDSTLNFDVVYFVDSSDYPTYVRVNQAVNLAIYEAFAEAKVDFAYPTQTLHIEK